MEDEGGETTGIRRRRNAETSERRGRETMASRDDGNRDDGVEEEAGDTTGSEAGGMPRRASGRGRARTGLTGVDGAGRKTPARRWGSGEGGRPRRASGALETTG